MDHPPANSPPSMRTALLSACSAAQQACRDAAHCDWRQVGLAGPSDLPLLLLELEELLAFTMRALQRGSSLHLSLTQACVAACEHVAAQCARWGHDPRLGECAAKCQACATMGRQTAQWLAAAYPHWSRSVA